MEGIFFILIGGALFSQAWYILGLYSDGRTMAVFVGGLGLLTLATIVFAPMLVTGESSGGALDVADHLAELTVMKSLIIVWALYGVGVATHGLWDFDERAIGFYSAFLSVISLVSFLYFATELQQRYTDAVWLGMSGASLALVVVAGIMFFYLAFAYQNLRLVAGWFALLGGGVISIIGLAMASTAVA